MLTAGMTGLTAAQNQTYMSLWAISGAPLLAGNNLATLSSTAASILTNKEVIAIDQDPRGLQGVGRRLSRQRDAAMPVLLSVGYAGTALMVCHFWCNKR